MKYFLSTPIYYVNAKPHIGHIYTTIAADVLARWHRQQGNDVLFTTGTDENSQKNVEAAESLGQPVKEYVDEMAKIWSDTFNKLGITHDTFIRTTAPEHKQAVESLLSAIEQTGDIYLGDYEGYYCVGCEDFIAEKDLVDEQCPNHNTKPKIIKEKNYFFKLSKYRDQLLAHYQDNPDFVQPNSARQEIISYITNDIKDVSISRQAQEWGIRLPQDKDHAVYVWFDALINYLTVTGYPNDQTKYSQYWPADLHLIGKDIIKFHCAIWPAMLLSAGLPLPKKIFAHGYFTIDGQKISKSLGNAIDPLEITQEYPFDAIRYYLLRDIPFGNDGNFSHQRLHDRYNADLANGLGNLVSRTLNLIAQNNIDPDRASKATNYELPDPGKAVAEHIDKLAFDKALSAIWKTISAADELIEQTKPWELAKQDQTEELEKILTTLYQSLVQTNQAIAPFLPDTHQQLTKLLQARPIRKPAQPLFARKD